MEYLIVDLELVQLCEELILKEVDKICIKHNIQYFVGGGTAIGQKRHGGFIPWDDDIDINMSRNDYDKFLEVASRELPDYLFLQNHRTDVNFSKLYTKVRLKNTKFVEYQYRNSKMEQGIYIDICPMDSAFNESEFLTKMNKQVMRLYKLYDYRINPSSNQPMNGFIERIKNIIKHIVHYILSILPKNYYSSKYYNLLRSNNVESDYIADFGTDNGKGFIIRKDVIFPVKRGQFDQIQVNIPNDIDTFLRTRYGDDYMTLPPEENRVNHSPLVLDFGNYTHDTVYQLLNK